MIEAINKSVILDNIIDNSTHVQPTLVLKFCKAISTRSHLCPLYWGGVLQLLCPFRGSVAHSCQIRFHVLGGIYWGGIFSTLIYWFTDLNEQNITSSVLLSRRSSPKVFTLTCINFFLSCYIDFSLAIITIPDKMVFFCRWYSIFSQNVFRTFT